MTSTETAIKRMFAGAFLKWTAERFAENADFIVHACTRRDVDEKPICIFVIFPESIHSRDEEPPPHFVRDGGSCVFEAGLVTTDGDYVSTLIYALDNCPAVGGFYDEFIEWCVKIDGRL